MNNWILPDIKKEIEAIDAQRTHKEQETVHEQFLKERLQPNYVLIDAALWEEDIDLLFSSNVPYRSLFRGSTGEKLWSVAPYLVDISADEDFMKLIKGKDPIERRVTWLHSSSNIDDLRKHLRRFLRMKKEDGTYIYFRFYDPFVVNNIFQNIEPQQSADFFEKIDYMIADDIRIEERHIFYLSAEKELRIKKQSLDYVDNK